MKLLAKIVNYLKLLTIFSKSSILDVWRALTTPLKLWLMISSLTKSDIPPLICIYSSKWYISLGNTSVSILKHIRCVYWRCSNTCGDAAICLRRNWDPPFVIDMDGLVEVKGIRSCVLLARSTEKLVFVMSCRILNFSRYFSPHSVIPLTIFTIISPNISSSNLDLVVSGGRGLLFCVDINNTFQTFSYPVYCIIFFLDWHFFKYWVRYFSFSRTLHSFHLRSF